MSWTAVPSPLLMWAARPCLVLIPTLVGNHSFLKFVYFVGLLLYPFNVFIVWMSFIWKKHTQTERFLYTGHPCALFIWTFWVFLSEVCRNTAFTLWKACSIHLWQVECVSVNVRRLFITFWCIHLEQGKSEAANFVPCLVSLYEMGRHYCSLYIKTKNSRNYMSSLWLTDVALRVIYWLILW